MHQDTIAAIATPTGYSAIGIIRISGPEAFNLADKIFYVSKLKSAKLANKYQLYLGKIIKPDSRDILDQAMAVFMPAPKSYTGENMVELHCHGNPLLLHKIMDLILSLGARLAEKGEFTRRAFLNNRINLLQAESISELSRASSEFQLINAARNLTGGSNFEKINALRKELISFLSGIESLLEFPEEDIKHIKIIQTIKIKKLIAQLKITILASEKFAGNQGLYKVVIIGPANSGKSTLFNALSEKDRAIVSNLPGTTRDYLEEDIIIEDIIIRFIDTAGFENKLALLNKKSIEKTHQVMKDANIILYVLDGSENNLSNKVEKQIINLQDKTSNFIVVINKSDILHKNLKLDKIIKKYRLKIFRASALKKLGLKKITGKIRHLFKKNRKNQFQEMNVYSQRQIELLRQTVNSLEKLSKKYPENNLEVMATEIKSSLENLDKITGKIYSEEMLNKIFDTFCIGK